MVPWWRASWSSGGLLQEQPCSGLKLWSSSSMWKGRNWYLTMTVRSLVSRNGRTHPLATVCFGGIWYAELCSREKISFLPSQCCSGSRQTPLGLSSKCFRLSAKELRRLLPVICRLVGCAFAPPRGSSAVSRVALLPLLLLSPLAGWRAYLARWGPNRGRFDFGVRKSFAKDTHGEFLAQASVKGRWRNDDELNILAPVQAEWPLWSIVPSPL